MVSGTNYGMFNDLGVYGVPRLVRERKRWEADLITLSDLLTDMSDLQQNKKRFDAVSAMRSMEEFTRSVGGYHFLYADTFLTRFRPSFAITPSFASTVCSERGQKMFIFWGI